MSPALQVGIVHELRFAVPTSKAVPALYPESDEFRVMPRVFATGYLVGLLEWSCIRLLKPYLDWPREQTVGTHIDVSHAAATPPGLEVLARATLDQQGRPRALRHRSGPLRRAARPQAERRVVVTLFRP